MEAYMIAIRVKGEALHRESGAGTRAEPRAGSDEGLLHQIQLMLDNLAATPASEGGGGGNASAIESLTQHDHQGHTTQSQQLLVQLLRGVRPAYSYSFVTSTHFFSRAELPAGGG
ncbi:uncharacterized protein MICPUCDRAFT_54862 [Micromonas pusilla CCMP1545]|uniref:Predicted protein n=1 Tax=Micromonas pusilla (strain CCMP1545) TaxID=564608 RepID=C1NAD9_MICPC|nr:uncharacterized protein MICPUCDRAFT_54862 [Micromonas pusilla CCMP1545]EEH50926.1 predicted protein [Micromonas pusilla CCMP1545]|eukprot:XP_003064946.1 predicted protein [Micromonas pusilla CCMP1545]